MAGKWKVGRKSRAWFANAGDADSRADRRNGASADRIGNAREGLRLCLQRLGKLNRPECKVIVAAVICAAIISSLNALAYSCRANRPPRNRFTPTAQQNRATLPLPEVHASAAAVASASDASSVTGGGGRHLGRKGDGHAGIMGAGLPPPAGGRPKGKGSTSLGSTSVTKAKAIRRIITPPPGLALAAKAFLNRDLLAMYNHLNTTSRDKGVRLALALAGYSEIVATSRDMAFLTVARSRAEVARHVEAVLMTATYALNHGHTYIVDVDPSFAASKCINNSIPEYLHKISAILFRLKHYGAIVYLDINAMIYNEPMKDLFPELLYKHLAVSPAQVYVADNAGRINSGVVMVKHSPSGSSFLKEWRKRSTECGCDRKQCGLDVPLASAIMLEVVKIKPKPGMNCSDPHVCARGKAHLCLKEQRNCRGLGYNNGIRLGEFSVLPQNDPVFRVNQWYARDAQLKEREAEGFYKPGDAVVRGKHLRDILDAYVFTARLRTALTSITKAAHVNM